MEADDAALRAHYELGMERERLSDGRGDLEFTRTTEIVLRRLPAAPAVVADIGGGPGRYALWLASLGYQVEHRDLMPLHVEQLRAEVAGVAGIHTAVGDHRPGELRDEMGEAGLEVTDLVSVEGPAFILGDLDARMADPVDRSKFTRTTEIVLRRLPAAPAVVADIGGGPGRYALWLASLGYQVEHRDLMPLHVEQLRAEASGVAGIHTAVGDARDLDLPGASVDAVLLLGPLYHLIDRAERVRALRECARIVRPGGAVFAAVISRWAVRIAGPRPARRLGGRRLAARAALPPHRPSRTRPDAARMRADRPAGRGGVRRGDLAMGRADRRLAA